MLINESDLSPLVPIQTHVVFMRTKRSRKLFRQPLR